MILKCRNFFSHLPCCFICDIIFLHQLVRLTFYLLFLDAIIEKIKEAGFHVAARKETTLTKDIAMMLYKQNADQEYHNDLIEHMTG